jgi:hypothetical protein
MTVSALQINPRSSRPKRAAKVLAYLTCATVFTKILFPVFYGGTIFDGFLVGLAVYGILSSRPTAFMAKVAMVWSCLIVFSYLLCVTYGTSVEILFRQAVPAMVVYVGMAGILKRTTSELLLVAYYRICVAAAAFGIVQFFASLGGIMLLMKSQARLNSFTYEPSHYAIAVAPALYLAISQIFNFKKFTDKAAWPIILSVVLTFSLTGLLLLLLCFSLAISSRHAVRSAICFLIALFGLFYFQEYLPEILRDRIDASEDAIRSGSSMNEIRSLSVLSPLSNWEVAVATLQNGRILGNGIGGHTHAYLDHFRNSSFAADYRFGMNAVSAHCLLIRSFSELGIGGLLAYLVFFFRGIIRIGCPGAIWWTLLSIYLAGRALKLGGFFELGCPIFMLAPFAYSSPNKAR